MRTHILFRILVVMVIIVLSVSACGQSDAHVVAGELRVVPAEAAPGETVWIYLDRIEATGDVQYAWTVSSGEILTGQNTHAIQYRLPDEAVNDVLVTVSVTAQNYHQELSILVNVAAGQPVAIPTLPPLPPPSCSSPVISATLLPYGGAVNASGTVEYCQSSDGKFAANIKLQGLPVQGSYLFTLQAADEAPETNSLLAQVFSDQTQTGNYYHDFALESPASTGDLQSQFSYDLLPGEYAFKFLIKDASTPEYSVVMNNDHPDPITITESLGMQKGITFVSWAKGEFASPEADQALEQLAATGANWIALVVTHYQDTGGSKEIKIDPAKTPTEDDVQHVIDKARELGLHVMLKPHIDVSDDSWRGDIGRDFKTDADWSAWFTAYREFINQYADLANKNQDTVKILCIGTELIATSSRDADWTQVLQEVDEIYDGELVYASNWDEGYHEWWKDLDYIGVDAYFPLGTTTPNASPSVEELKTVWNDPVNGPVKKLEDLHNRLGIRVILTEIGYRSISGAHAAPHVSYDASREETVDPMEQSNLYQAAFETLLGKQWVAGMYWWNWVVRLDKEYIPRDYTPQGKPAEAILTKFYGSSHAPLIVYKGPGECPSVPIGATGRVLFSTKTDDLFQGTLTFSNLESNHGYVFTLSCKKGDVACLDLLPTASNECSAEADGYCDIPIQVLTNETGSLENDLQFDLPGGTYDLKFFIKDPSFDSCVLLNNDNPGPFTVEK